MIRYEREIGLQRINFSNNQKDEFELIAAQNNVQSEILMDTGEYLVVADLANEDGSMDALLLVIEWLEKKNIAYTLWEINNHINFKGETTYDVLKNKQARRKAIFAEAEFNLENDDNYWD